MQIYVKILLKKVAITSQCSRWKLEENFEILRASLPKFKKNTKHGPVKPGFHIIVSEVRVVSVVPCCGQAIADNSGDSYVVRFPRSRLSGVTVSKGTGPNNKISRQPRDNN